MTTTGLKDRPISGEEELPLAVAATMAVAMRRPELWPIVSQVRPEWLPEHADRVLWQGILHTLSENDGLGELAVLEGWLRSHHPADTDFLLERLAAYIDCALYREYIEHDVPLLRAHGERREVRAYGQHLVRLVDERAPMSVIWRALADAPRPTHREGGGDYA